MIDLSKYLNRTLEVRLKDKTIHVYEPSLEMVKEYFEKESNRTFVCVRGHTENACDADDQS